MDTRQRIIQAALEAYGDGGFRGATTRRIAALAGVNEVTIFRHFGSKKALLAEALRGPLPGAGPVRLPDAPVDPTQELIAWTKAQLGALSARSQVIRASMGDWRERPELVDGIVEYQETALTTLIAYLERLRVRGLARSPVDLNTVATMLAAAIHADAIRSRAEPQEHEVSDRAKAYVTVVLAALGAAGIASETPRPERAPAPPSLPDATGA